MIITAYCPGDRTAEHSTISANHRSIYISPELYGEDGAAHFTDHAEVIQTDLLSEIPGLPGRALSAFRRFIWWICWYIGIGAAAESRHSAYQRAQAFVSKVMKASDSCIIIARPGILKVVLRQLERKGFQSKRSRSGAIQPGELIRITRKSDHCGGCNHNCLLSNPGCGIGKEKAKYRS